MKKTFAIVSALLIACMITAVFAGCAETPATTTAADTKKPADETTAAETTAAETTAEAVTTAAETEAETTEEVTTEPETTEAEPQGDVFEIGSREELFAFADKVLNGEAEYEDMTIRLTADIDLDPTLDGGKNWVPLSSEGLDYIVFDGNGHVINGMTIMPEDLEVAGNDGKIYGSGFFGVTTTSIAIKNLTFTNAHIVSDTKHCGCVIGSAEQMGSLVELDNVTVSGLTLNGGVGVVGDTTGISFRVGGLIGANIAGAEVDVRNCTVQNSKIFGFHNISGLVGCTTDAMFTFENNTVKNLELNYSAGYATNEKYHVTEDIRYFADPFYCINDHWGEYHTDVDKESGNSLEGLDSYDVAFDIHYKDEEGKNADNPGYEEDGVIYFPAVGGSTIRPKDER